MAVALCLPNHKKKQRAGGGGGGGEEGQKGHLWEDGREGKGDTYPCTHCFYNNQNEIWQLQTPFIFFLS